MIKIMLISLLTLMLITGCGASTAPVEPEGADLVSDPPPKAFVYNSIMIEMHAPAEPILENLGEPASYFEAASCAHQGMDRVYTYPGFELHTYERDGIERVLAVILLNDSISTPEGLHLSSPIEDILKHYGEVPQQMEGVFVYSRENTRLSILVRDNRILEIAYLAVFNKSR